MPDKNNGETPSYGHKPPPNSYLFRRIAVYIVGLFCIAFGIALSINADLGISPVTSLPFVVSLILETDMGIVVPSTFAAMMLLQIILLRRKFKLISLTQMIFSTIFGYFIDAARIIIGDFLIPTYFGQLILLAASIIFIALGLLLSIRTRLVPMPSESLLVTLAEVIPNSRLHIVKIVMDCVIVAMAMAGSLIFLGEVHAIREGTVLSAIFVGKAIPYIEKAVLPILVRIKAVERPV